MFSHVTHRLLVSSRFIPRAGFQIFFSNAGILGRLDDKISRKENKFIPSSYEKVTFDNLTKLDCLYLRVLWRREEPWQGTALSTELLSLTIFEGRYYRQFF